MTAFVNDSFFGENSDGVSERISLLENYIRGIDLDTNSVKVISAGTK